MTDIRRVRSGFLSLVLPGLIGFVGASAVYLIAGRVTDRSTAPQSSASTSPEESSQPTRDETTSEATAAGRALIEAASRATRDRPSAETSGLSPKEEAEQRLQRYQQRIENVRDEPGNAAWAPRAHESVLSVLTDFGQSHDAKVLNVDCRTRSCLAELEWRTVGAARSGYRDLLQGQYQGLNCDSEVHFPSADQASP